ncbi:hypothetical protein D3C85_1824970 [compost metagenome]
MRLERLQCIQFLTSLAKSLPYHVIGIVRVETSVKLRSTLGTPQPDTLQNLLPVLRAALSGDVTKADPATFM